ncbi:TetR/AcrR family transcriptional regulator [Micrococcales bacterium 31B]|nr:TetR/AcrR family transcriptional regulator [Micrococcales bacterium 31B]
MNESNPNVRGVRRRAALVASARALFASAGYSGVSMSQIASHAGVTHAGLLYHFATKEEVLAAVLEGQAPRDAETGSRGAGCFERLRALVASNSEDFEWMRLFSTLTGEAVSEEHPLHDSFARRYAEIERSLARQLTEVAAVAGREVSEGEARSLARLLIAAMDGLQVQATMQSADSARAAARMREDFDLALDLVRARLGPGSLTS